MSGADPHLAEAVRWRRELHREPELGLDLPRTTTFVAGQLRRFGLEVHEDVGGGVVAVLSRGAGGRKIGLRADMDALAIHELNSFAHASRRPGLMHACGHDGHTAMLLGAAAVLAAREDLDAKLTFVFQPDEEHGQGARAMIEAGLFERFEIDEIYGLHNAPGLPVGVFATREGPIAAAEDNFEIELQGAGGHAAHPQQTQDVLIAGCQLVTALQSIISRNVAPQAPAVLSVTELVTDGARNVLPKRCVLKGDVRTFDPTVQALIETRMRALADAVAGGFGVTARTLYTHEFAATLNAAAATRRACAAAVRAGCQVIPDRAPVMGSDDFGLFLQHRPGNYAQLGNGAPGEPGSAPLHSPTYDFNDEAIPYGIAYFVALATGAAAAPVC